jgi:hypothetical protein
MVNFNLGLMALLLLLLYYYIILNFLIQINSINDIV